MLDAAPAAVTPPSDPAFPSPSPARLLGPHRWLCACPLFPGVCPFFSARHPPSAIPVTPVAASSAPFRYSQSAPWSRGVPAEYGPDAHWPFLPRTTLSSRPSLHKTHQVVLHPHLSLLPAVSQPAKPRPILTLASVLERVSSRLPRPNSIFRVSLRSVLATFLAPVVLLRLHRSFAVA